MGLGVWEGASEVSDVGGGRTVERDYCVWVCGYMYGI